MRIPSHHLRLVAGALVCLVPLPARSQTDTLLKLSTTVPQAATDFRARGNAYENFSIASGASHFQSAMTAAPNFGHPRARYGLFGAAFPGALPPGLGHGHGPDELACPGDQLGGSARVQTQFVDDRYRSFH